ncbi:MAG TPA: hypothetical protein VGP72_10945 [Planctomycetota bacterium]|jgi:hypothetical protein
MDLKDFRIGVSFFLSGRKYLCTDVGSRTVAAIPLADLTIRRNGNETPISESEARKHGWLSGPPYPVQELILDEIDIEACSERTRIRKRTPTKSVSSNTSEVLRRSNT